MVHTIHNVLLSQCSHSLDDDGVVAVLNDARELLGPQGPELLLHLAEGELYRVIIWTVGHIIDVAEAELPHRLLALLGGVCREVVHEQADFIVTVRLPQLS